MATRPEPIPASWQRPAPMAASNAFPLFRTRPRVSTVCSCRPSETHSISTATATGLSHRDAADTRIVAQYQSGGSGGYWPNGVTFTGQLTIPQPPPTGRMLPIVNGTPCVESLHDGIPDQWKKNNGLSTTDASLYKKVDRRRATRIWKNIWRGSGRGYAATPTPAPPTRHRRHQPPAARPLRPSTARPSSTRIPTPGPWAPPFPQPAIPTARQTHAAA